MDSSVEIAERVYHLFTERKWREIQSIYEESNFYVLMPLNHLGDTALHLAAYSEDFELMRSLLNIVYHDEHDKEENSPTGLPSLEVDLLEDEDGNERPVGGLKGYLENDFGNTPLHEAASKGNVKLVELMLNFDEKKQLIMTKTRNKDDQTPFFMAAIYGHTNLIKCWVERRFDNNPSLDNIEDHVKTDHSTMLHEAIRGYHYDTAVELLDPKYCIPMDQKDLNGKTCFQLLADIPEAFESGYRYSFSLLDKLIYAVLPVPKDKDASDNESEVNSDTLKLGFSRVQRLRRKKRNHSRVMKLTKALAEEDKSWQGHKTTDGQSDTPVTPPIAAAKNGIKEKDTPLIAASKNGITEIVEAILDVFPEAIEHENHKGENVFHVAVQNRKTNVLDLLEDKKFKYLRFIRKLDKKGDGILHKAAYKTEILSRERPGEALCLQSDIQWFERVKKMVPADYVNHKNNKGDTPQALFTKEHKELVKEGKEWLIRTTNSCIIVAVLIATVAFTSIYTVPGGSNSKTGKPLLLNTTPFTIFTSSDVASLCFAFTSVVVFLSITTSKMNEQDFRISLPLKLVLGLSMLFFSVAALMVGFAATLVMTIRNRLHQASAPIIAIACIPVAIFLFLQLPLYCNITWFTVKDLVRSLIRPIPKQKKRICVPRP